MPSKRVNVEPFFRGRSHRKGEGASNPRESGATQYAKMTISEHRDRSAREADRRTSNNS